MIIVHIRISIDNIIESMRPFIIPVDDSLDKARFFFTEWNVAPDDNGPKPLQ